MKTIDTTGMPVRKQQCSTCVFKPVHEGGGAELTAERHAEIRANCINGINQICHHDDNKTICRGGRDFQLMIWSRLGIIPEPTDEALAKAIKKTLGDKK